MNLIIRFPDQSSSFAYGVEYGRILHKIESGMPIVSNGPFPIRIENKEVLISTCKHYGYEYSFQPCIVEGWEEFIATKNILIN